MHVGVLPAGAYDHMSCSSSVLLTPLQYLSQLVFHHQCWMDDVSWYVPVRGGEGTPTGTGSHSLLIPSLILFGGGWLPLWHISVPPLRYQVRPLYIVWFPLWSLLKISNVLQCNLWSAACIHPQKCLPCLCQGVCHILVVIPPVVVIYSRVNIL